MWAMGFSTDYFVWLLREEISQVIKNIITENRSQHQAPFFRLVTLARKFGAERVVEQRFRS